MAKKISKQMNIVEILNVDEGLADVFMEFGMPCLGCAAAHFENLEQACSVHGVDADALEDKLNEYLDANA